MKIVEKFIADTYAVIILILAVITVPAVLYFVFHQSPLSIFNVLILVPNLVYSLVKNFRQKILFRKSSPVLTANKGPKVLFWILDGCTVEAFLDVARSNEDLRILFGEGYFSPCVTIFPSVTPAAHAALMTGCYPVKTRIPGFDWVNVRTTYTGTNERSYVRVMPDFKRFLQQVSSSTYRKEFFEGLGDALDLNQQFLSPFVSTIFETLKEKWCTESIKEWIHRGADRFFGASINSLLDDLVSSNLIPGRSMMDLLAASYKEFSYEFGDLIWGSTEPKTLADLVVYWKSGTDTVSHEFGPQSARLKDEIAEAIEKLAETLKFYRMYTSQPLYVVITSDHGQSVVSAFSLLEEEMETFFSGRYRIAGRGDRADDGIIGTADIIIANNDRAAFIHIFRQLPEKTGIRDELITFLKGRRDIDLILFGNETPRVIQVHDDGTCTGPENIDEFFSGREHTYPCGAARVRGLMAGKMCGDIVISLKEGYTLNPDFGDEAARGIHGDHGGLGSEDSLVPLLVWGPGIRANPKDGNQTPVRLVDIAPTVAALFGETQRNADGRVLAEIFGKAPMAKGKNPDA